MVDSARVPLDDEKRPGGKFYVVVLHAMVLALVAGFVAPLAAGAFPLAGGETFPRLLQALLGIAMLSGPLPAKLSYYVPLPHLAVAAFDLVQMALLARRLWLSARAGGVALPAAFEPAWNALFVLGFASWLGGGAAFVADKAQLAEVLYIPAANVFGATFFVVEILSLNREGLRPPARETAQRGGGARIAGTVALMLVILLPFWTLVPTALVHRRLCETRSGPHVYATVRAASYLLAGLSSTGDGPDLYEALDDVAAERAEFIEFMKEPRNPFQRLPFRILFGTADPPGSTFRAELGPAGSSDCAKRVVHRSLTRLDYGLGLCLRLIAIAAPTSRYRVEVVDGQPAAWYVPGILTYGARVVDRESGRTLGEYLRFTRTGRLAFYFAGEKNYVCPSREHFRSEKLHREVLLGAK